MPAPIGGSSPTFIPYPMIFFVTIPNFPEWAIPMTKIIPRVYIDDAYDITQVIFQVSCQHFWKVNRDTSSVSLKVIIQAQATNNAVSPSIVIPTYLDIDLVFKNERVCDEVNTNKL